MMTHQVWPTSGSVGLKEMRLPLLVLGIDIEKEKKDILVSKTQVLVLAN